MKPVFEAAPHRSDPRFKIFHELMRRKIREVLFISSPYDAWVMETDRGLSEAIVQEYRGLNLSHPPRLNWAASVGEAVRALERQPFDLVIIMSQADEFPFEEVGRRIKMHYPALPIVWLYHRAPGHLVSWEADASFHPDRTFMWSGDTTLLLAVIKSIEDRLNVDRDTGLAAIRVIIFVEDSPEYLASLLPEFYKELVSQTHSVIEEGLNHEHRLLTMRARPKILIAESYEAAMGLFEQYEEFVLGVISDVRFPRGGAVDGEAGIRLLRTIHERRFDIPLLLASSEPENSARAALIPADFVDKNSANLHEEVRSFFLNRLGFGPFIFKKGDNTELRPVKNLLALERCLGEVPDRIFYNHWIRNDFSRWLFTRAETVLATELRDVTAEDFDSDLEQMRNYLRSKIRERRLQRQQGVLVDFDSDHFDPDTEFLKMGDGSLGGKARGLAFFSSMLHQRRFFKERFPGVDIYLPHTLIITTECFETFIRDNNLAFVLTSDLANEQVARAFMRARFPAETRERLRVFLQHVGRPLAVRSSSLLEDAKYRAYAGLYSTYMLANDDDSDETRLERLVSAIKMVYASTYYREPKAFSRRVGNRVEEEQMAIVIQQVVGDRYGDCFYPALSGVAQSHNFYPFAHCAPEDGIATIALGLGTAVTSGEKSLRFSPRYPALLPQCATVADTLKNTQRYFYALKLGEPAGDDWTDDSLNLKKREIADALDEEPVRRLAAAYDPEEQRIRGSYSGTGVPVLTFDALLKYETVPLAAILRKLLAAGTEGMGGPVEIEFSLTLPGETREKAGLAILQIRPMGASEETMKVDIDLQDSSRYFCISTRALGNTESTGMRDLLYVKPDAFDPGQTVRIAHEIARFNGALTGADRKYLLIGPGRWGSADRWLGIPVSWGDICGVGAIVEAHHPRINAEPSQGSHFFHNIASLGINYLSVVNPRRDVLDWNWIEELEIEAETEFVAHVRRSEPFLLKVDGRSGVGVIFR